MVLHQLSRPGRPDPVPDSRPCSRMRTVAHMLVRHEQTSPPACRSCAGGSKGWWAGSSPHGSRRAAASPRSRVKVPPLPPAARCAERWWLAQRQPRSAEKISSPGKMQSARQQHRLLPAVSRREPRRQVSALRADGCRLSSVPALRPSVSSPTGPMRGPYCLWGSIQFSNRGAYGVRIAELKCY